MKKSEENPSFRKVHSRQYIVGFTVLQITVKQKEEWSDESMRLS